ncbi:hypothetical protein AOLI_G00113300 [Acnodon oligacanthus]
MATFFHVVLKSSSKCLVKVHEQSIEEWQNMDFQSDAHPAQYWRMNRTDRTTTLLQNFQIKALRQYLDVSHSSPWIIMNPSVSRK